MTLTMMLVVLIRVVLMNILILVLSCACDSVQCKQNDCPYMTMTSNHGDEDQNEPASHTTFLY